MMPAPSDLVSTIAAARKTYEAASSVRAATICDGDTEMRDGLIREVDAQFKNLATALGYAVDRLDDDTAREAVEVATMRSRHLDALHQQRAWVEHWMSDVSAGLKPTPESLNRSLDGIDAAIAAVEATPIDDTARSTVEGIMAGHDAMVDALAGER